MESSSTSNSLLENNAPKIAGKPQVKVHLNLGKFSKFENPASDKKSRPVEVAHKRAQGY
jgi:hypothetical protein